ncbi:hypothetical protein ABZV31_09705 [Streptomyces sp. NPDC005202]|uniref:hypothetical protein n=1 Tax=Streptomyces sp. NPDC005202 TaxID=3157021 RepID=UPI0033A7D5BB
MPRFPEWQQDADRHSHLIDPVLTVRQLSRFEFSLKSYVRIDHALVFSTAKGEYEAYLPPRRPTRTEVVAKHYTSVYEVDMGVHPHTAHLTLPSANDALEFTAEVDLSWQVLDPARFVASGHRDVPGLLLGELQQAARPVTRRFAIADSAAAEAELLERMHLLGPLGAPAGLQVTWTLRLRRDQANIDHELRQQAIDHAAAEQIRAAQRGMEVDVEIDRRNRQQDRLQIERATAYGDQQQELLLQQQRWQHERALLSGQQQLELQRIEAEKIAFYQWHLQQGGVHTWALHLAQHPEDSHLVMTSMREDQLRMIQAQMDLVKQLLSGDSAENWELEGPKQLALRTVNDILNQRLPGVPQTPPPLPQGGGPAYPGAAIPPEGGGGQPGPAGQPGSAEDVQGAADTDPQHEMAQATEGEAQPPGGHAAPTGPYPTGPYPGAAATVPGPYGVPGAPTMPGTTGPTPYAPPPPGHVPPPPPGVPGPYPGVPASPPSAAVPQPPAWQPPPGYGSTPTLPAQNVPDAATPADAANNVEDSGT